MTTLYCPRAEDADYHSVKVVGLHPKGDDLICPDHGCQMSSFKPRRRSLSRSEKSKLRPKQSSLKRARRRESAAEKRARERFNDVVKAAAPLEVFSCWLAYRPCRNCEGYFPECQECPIRETQVHSCGGELDAHHLVEKQWIRRNYADLSEPALLAILFDPRIGAPLCRVAHDGIKQHPVHWHELSSECIEACEEADARWLNVPTPSGARRASMLERLRIECPLIETTEAVTAASERSTA